MTDQPEDPGAPGDGAPPSASPRRPASAADAPGPVRSGGDEVDEDGLDLSDLDRLGIDGVVAQLRGADDPEGAAEDLRGAGLGKRRRAPRSPAASVVVLGAAIFLLVTMWPDFRYWLRSSEPEDLGTAAELVASGRLDAGDLHDRYVALEGTPDVQHPARLTTKTNYIGYLRITEGGGRLFAAVPRDKDDKPVTTFAGRYVGRIHRLGSDRAYPWLEQFFRDQNLTEPIDVPAGALLSAVEAAPGQAARVDAEQGAIEIGPQERVRIVVDTPDVRLQLGKRSFTANEARQAVAALGVPFLEQEPGPTFHRFVARIPARDREAALAQLRALVEDASDAANDPRVGAELLPMRSTYVAEVGQLRVGQDGALSFPYGDNTTPPGHRVEGGALVSEQLGERATLTIDRGSILAVRYERPIAVDPNGWLVTVDADPASERMAGILWLVVLGLAAANAFSLVVWWRRRTGPA